jgi:ATP-binding cassette subfamily F protein uup
VLLSIQDCHHQLGSAELFTGLDLGIDDGERLAIVGANGSGKSSLLKLMAGTMTPDSGRIARRSGALIAYVAQEEATDDPRPIEAALAANLTDRADHERDALVDRALREHGFPERGTKVSSLSGGWRKRLAIVAGLLPEPDLVLLDEPTNHLDLDGRRWLEATLRRSRQSCVVVSHDRWFLDRISTRVVELAKEYEGGCFSAQGDYAHFLDARDADREARRKEQAALANRHRREQDWLRRQPKARTTKNVARIKQAGDLGAQLSDLSRRNREAKRIDLGFQATGRQTQDLLLGEGLACDRGGRQLFAGLDVAVGPGERIGLIGGNGSGKSSLLACLAGELPLAGGRVKRAHGLRVATFDQTRSALDRSTTLARALSPEGDQVVVGERTIHIRAWAQRFLFNHDRLDQVVGSLSGGEQARLLIAQLVRRPADLLVLDEPTNDLDIPALEVLEESLLDFPGGVLLVTHDRWLLDRVCTGFIALDGAGRWRRVGSYRQFEDQEKQGVSSEKSAQNNGPAEPAGTDKPKPTGSGLSFAEQKELRSLEGRIEKAEAALEEAANELSDPAINTVASKLEPVQQRWQELRDKVDGLYARWEELEAKGG